MFRFPYTLWFATLKDMWRLIALTTAVIVTILAFAACIKPLSDGKLDVGDLPHFMSLALLPMLAYALPFSGAFGATLVYHRLATDWELTAAHACGISLRKMLVPAAFTGLILGGALLVLNEFVIPGFLRNMEKLITTDVPKLLANAIDNGRPLNFGDTIIYADSVQRVEPEKDSGATDQLVLTKLMTIKRDNAGNIESEATATVAGLWVYPPETTTDGSNRSYSTVAILLKNSVATQRGHDSGKDTAATLVASKSSEFAMAVPNVFKDNVKFASFSRLRELRVHPEQLSKIDVKRRDLAYIIGVDQLMQSLTATLKAEHRIALTHEDEDESIVIRAGGLTQTAQGWAVQPVNPGGKIDLELVRKGAREGASGVARYSTDTVLLTPSIHDERSSHIRLKLEATNARNMSGVVDTSPNAAPGLPRYTRGDLIYPASSMDALLHAPIESLLDTAQAAPDGSAARTTADRLRFDLRDMMRDITSKQHERLAFAAATMVMVLAGALSAVRLHGKLPLTVYLWAFFPALGCVITIAGGQQLNRSYGTPGLIMLWAGVGVLSLVLIRVYSHLSRN